MPFWIGRGILAPKILKKFFLLFSAFVLQIRIFVSKNQVRLKVNICLFEIAENECHNIQHVMLISDLKENSPKIIGSPVLIYHAQRSG
jgi:hypothetical protein